MSQLTFPFIVALRYSIPYINKGMAGFLSFVSLVGLALAVFALILVMSVMNGFEKELQSRMLALLPHAQLTWSDPNVNWREVMASIEKDTNVLGAAPYTEGTVLLSVNNRITNATLVGIDPDLEHKVSILDNYLISGELQDISEKPYGIIIGRFIARQLGLDIGDKINLTIPRVFITPLGPLTRKKRFEVVGIFEVGTELDQQLVLTHIHASNKLFSRRSSIDGLRLSVDNQQDSYHIVKKAVNVLINRGELPATVTSTDWREKNRTLYRAVKMEKIMIFVLLMSVVAVASFNVISIILMTVTDKRSDIAVLKTMGASTLQIRRLFVFQGAMIGTIGTLIGAIPAIMLAPKIGSALQRVESMTGWKLFDPNVYYIPYLPSDLHFQDVFLVIASAISISILVTFVPAVRASRINPALIL